MADYFTMAIAAGLAIAAVNTLFAWHDTRSPRRSLRTFVGWMLAFVAAGVAAPAVARWLLSRVF